MSKFYLLEQKERYRFHIRGFRIQKRKSLLLRILEK